MIIAGLDIGSNTVRVAVAQKKKGSNRLLLLGVGEAPSAGIRRGTVVDPEEATAAIAAALASAEQAAGYRVKSVYVGISGSHLASRYAKGVVSVSRADQEVSKDDVARVVAQAQSIAAPQNKEIVHVLPKEYIVDGEGGIHDPLGMHGLRLEMNALVVEASTSVVKNLLKCVENAGADVDGVVAASYAASFSAISNRQRELGVLVLDIGGTTSSLAAFEEGSMIHAATLPVGSAHITNDIAIGLQVDIDVAEMIKVRYGVCRPESVNKREMITIGTEGDAEPVENVSRREVAEIVEARLDELFELADKELKKISRQALFPAGVVIVGGGANMDGIVEFAKSHLRLPAHVGAPEHIEGATEQFATPQYVTVLGLCLAGLQQEEHGDSAGMFSSVLAGRPADFFRKWFRAFLP